MIGSISLIGQTPLFLIEKSIHALYVSKLPKQSLILLLMSVISGLYVGIIGAKYRALLNVDEPMYSSFEQS